MGGYAIRGQVRPDNHAVVRHSFISDWKAIIAGLINGWRVCLKVIRGVSGTFLMREVVGNRVRTKCAGAF